MAFVQGIDFRQTSGFVTDPTNYQSSLGAVPSTPQYPSVLSPSGVNGGWETGAADSRDRQAYTGAAASVAGNIFPGNGGPTTITFRIDLPATGSYDVFCGAGDANYTAGPITVSFKDTTTVYSTPISAATTAAADHYFDATGVERTSHTDWVNNSAANTHTFATTIFRMDVIGPICNVFVQAGGGAAAPTFRRANSNTARAGSRPMGAVA